MLVETVTEWAKDLVIISLVFAFAEMLLPANDLRKFARVVIGVVMIAVIVGSVLDISGAIDDVVESQAGFGVNQIGTSDRLNWMARGELIAYAGLEIVGAEAETRIAAQLESVARLASGAGEANAEIEFTSRGDIRSIRIALSNLNMSGFRASSVETGNSGAYSAPDRRELAAIIEERVINAIRDFYGFSRDLAINVSVTL